MVQSAEVMNGHQMNNNESMTSSYSIDEGMIFNYLILMCREIILIIYLQRKFGYPIPDGNCSSGALHLLVGANYFWQQLFRHLGDQRGEQSQPSAIEFHLLGLRRAG